MQFEGVGYDQEYDEENLSGEDCEYETWGGAGGTAGGKAKKRSVFSYFVGSHGSGRPSLMQGRGKSGKHTKMLNCYG